MCSQEMSINGHLMVWVMFFNSKMPVWRVTIGPFKHPAETLVSNPQGKRHQPSFVIVEKAEGFQDFILDMGGMRHWILMIPSQQSERNFGPWKTWMKHDETYETVSACSSKLQGLFRLLPHVGLAVASPKQTHRKKKHQPRPGEPDKGSLGSRFKILCVIIFKNSS